MQNEPIFLKRKKACAKQRKKRSTGPSRVVPHRSTTPARTSLTSLFGWEAVSLVDMAALIEMVVLWNILLKQCGHSPQLSTTLTERPRWKRSELGQLLLNDRNCVR